MNKSIQIFDSPQFGQVRTMVGDDGEPWLVGKDVAKILGYANPTKAVMTHVDEDDKLHSQIGNAGQNRTMLFINESGLYSLILLSKLPQAKEFKHWVTAVVLPQIRKTGGYIPINEGEDENSLMARALLIAKKTIDMKDGLLDVQRPKVRFADAITSHDGSILIRDLAKLITQNGVNIGQTRLFCWMRLHGYLFQNETRPIQKWVERGLFDTTITLIHTHHGTREHITTKVTGKGQRYFLEGFMSGRFQDN